jgi:sialidase-1
MKLNFTFTFLIIVSISCVDNHDVTEWKGFTRYNFTLDQREARLVVPDHPLPGNPWLWHARFPDYHSEIDSMLAAEGFHIAYINTDNQFGSPDAMATWDHFYTHLTDTYKLQQKVALSGTSRGGLFIYNWAKRNPEKVAVIYAEAPVCDIKSWPAGFGSGEGSAEAWSSLKEEYGFASDEEARAYADNPLDNLEGLVKAKIPILHTIGLNDKIVPPEENTFLLVDTYIRLGGSATVIPCTEGVQNLEGHHFPIDNPRRIVDLIKYHSTEDGPLDASLYHQMRGGLHNCQTIFEQTGKGRVAFLGGSITYGSGWRDSICKYLVHRFPDTEFEFIPAGIPSMGSTPAAFRLERDVLQGSPIDLLFEEAAVNDASNGRTNTEQIRAMEGIVRHLRRSNPNADMVMMHFVDPEKMENYKSGREPEVITNHNLVAEHYQIPIINLAKEVTDRIDHGEFNWEDDFKDLHPSPFGQGVYAHSMIQLLGDAFDGPEAHNNQVTPHLLPDPLDANCYENGYLRDISSATYSSGWQVDSLWNPGKGKRVRPNYVDVPMLIGNEPGSALKLTFDGKAVGIAVAAGSDAGMIDYRIDKGDWQRMNLFTDWSMHLHLPWYYTLAGDLAHENHLLEMKISRSKDERSEGHACRIRYFYVNGLEK